MDMTVDRKWMADLFDEHVQHEFAHKDLDATMATMTAEPHLCHMPTLTGGDGREAVRNFYRDHFIPRWPADVKVTPVSRTIGEDRVVDELVISFTHDVVMDFMLPGVAPTGRFVEQAIVVVVGFEEGRIAYERIYWDQGSLLAQVGLLDKTRLPVIGAEQAMRLRDGAAVPLNRLLERK